MNIRRFCMGLTALLVLAAAIGWAVRKPGRTTTLKTHAAVVLATPGPAPSTPTPSGSPSSGAPPLAAVSAAVAAGCPLTAEQRQMLQGVAALLERGGESADGSLAPLRAWAAQDPAACARWVLENLDGASRRRCLEEAIAIWTQQQGPQGPLDWLDQQTRPGVDADTLAGAYTLALSTLAEQDGTLAVSWLRGHPTQGTAANWGNVLETWAENHPADALPWVTAPGNLEPGLKGALLPNLLASFRDPGATEMLLRGSPPAVMDDALVKAARATSTLDPAYSLGLARQIQNPAARNEAIHRAFDRWLETDADAARSFAARTSLPLPVAAIGQSTMQEQPLGTVPPDAPLVLPH